MHRSQDRQLAWIASRWSCVLIMGWCCVTMDSLPGAEEQEMYQLGGAGVECIESGTGDAGPEPRLDCIAIAHLVPRFHH